MTGVQREFAKIKRKASSLSQDIEQLEQLIQEGKQRSPSNSENDIITIDEMAAILSVSVTTIRRYIKKGRLTPYQMGKKYYWLRSELPQQLKTGTKAIAKKNEGECADCGEKFNLEEHFACPSCGYLGLK